MCVTHIPSPMDNARRKIEHIYTGPLDTELVESMFECSPEVCLSFDSHSTRCLQKKRPWCFFCDLHETPAVMMPQNHVNVSHLTWIMSLHYLVIHEMLIAHVLPLSCERKKSPEIIARQLWPPDLPDLNPLGNSMCGILQGNVYKIRISDLYKLETAPENGVGQAGSCRHCGSHSSVASSPVSACHGRRGDILSTQQCRWLQSLYCLWFLLQMLMTCTVTRYLRAYFFSRHTESSWHFSCPVVMTVGRGTKQGFELSELVLLAWSDSISLLAELIATVSRRILQNSMQNSQNFSTENCGPYLHNQCTMDGLLMMMTMS